MSDNDFLDEPIDPENLRQYEACIVEPLGDILARSPNPDEVWLFCIECDRFFQAKYLREDFQGNREGCAFCQCAGFNVDIHLWDTATPARSPES